MNAGLEDGVNDFGLSALDECARFPILVCKVGSWVGCDNQYSDDGFGGRETSRTKMFSLLEHIKYKRRESHDSAFSNHFFGKLNGSHGEYTDMDDVDMYSRAAVLRKIIHLAYCLNLRGRSVDYLRPHTLMWFSLLDDIRTDFPAPQVLGHYSGCHQWCGQRIYLHYHNGTFYRACVDLAILRRIIAKDVLDKNILRLVNTCMDRLERRNQNFLEALATREINDPNSVAGVVLNGANGEWTGLDDLAARALREARNHLHRRALNVPRADDDAAAGLGNHANAVRRVVQARAVRPDPQPRPKPVHYVVTSQLHPSFWSGEEFCALDPNTQ